MASPRPEATVCCRASCCPPGAGSRRAVLRLAGASEGGDARVSATRGTDDSRATSSAVEFVARVGSWDQKRTQRNAWGCPSLEKKSDRKVSRMDLFRLPDRWGKKGFDGREKKGCTEKLLTLERMLLPLRMGDAARLRGSPQAKPPELVCAPGEPFLIDDRNSEVRPIRVRVQSWCFPLSSVCISIFVQ